MIRVIYVTRNAVRTITRKPRIQAARPTSNVGAEWLLGVAILGLIGLGIGYFCYMTYHHGLPTILWNEILMWGIFGTLALIFFRWVKVLAAVVIGIVALWAALMVCMYVVSFILQVIIDVT